MINDVFGTHEAVVTNIVSLSDLEKTEDVKSNVKKEEVIEEKPIREIDISPKNKEDDVKIINVEDSDISKDSAKNSVFNYNEDIEDTSKDSKIVEHTEIAKKEENKSKKNFEQISFLENLYSDENAVSSELNGLNK